MQTLPAVAIILPLFIGLCFIFLATTVDSSAYILASICSTQLSGYEEPTRTNRILWTVLIAIVGTGLLLVGGFESGTNLHHYWSIADDSRVIHYGNFPTQSH